MSGLVWSVRAEADLEHITDYIAEDDPVAARRWVGRLMDRALRASRFPAAGTHPPEIDREDVREVFVRTYRILYQVRRRDILILTVFEGHQRFPLEALPEDGAED